MPAHHVQNSACQLSIRRPMPLNIARAGHTSHPQSLSAMTGQAQLTRRLTRSTSSSRALRAATRNAGKPRRSTPKLKPLQLSSTSDSAPTSPSYYPVDPSPDSPTYEPSAPDEDQSAHNKPFSLKAYLEPNTTKWFGDALPFSVKQVYTTIHGLCKPQTRVETLMIKHDDSSNTTALQALQCTTPARTQHPPQPQDTQAPTLNSQAAARNCQTLLVATHCTSR